MMGPSAYKGGILEFLPTKISKSLKNDKVEDTNINDDLVTLI